MINRLRRAYLCATLLAALAPLGAIASPLQDLAGHSRQLGDYAGKGKWLVVMLWASDCHVCNVEAHQYVDYHNRHHSGNVSVLGVSMDGVAHKAEALAFIRAHAVTFPNLIGEPEDVADLYTNLTGHPWVGTPTFLIYDPTGKLRAQQVGAIPADLIDAYIAQNGAAASH